MNRKRVALYCVMAALALPGSEFGGVLIKGQSSKPLSDICVALKDQMRWRVTFEEAPVLWPEDAVRERNPQLLRERLVARSSPVEVEIPSDRNITSTALKASLEKILSAYHKSGNRGTYRYVLDGAYIHILPSAVRGRDGQSLALQPVLDTPVTIPKGSYNILSLVHSMLEQIRRQRGIAIVDGYIPMNLFVQSRVTLEARDEPARAVLARAFTEVDKVRRADGMPAVGVVWHLLYNATDEYYVFNVSGVPHDEDDALPPRPAVKGGTPESKDSGPFYNSKSN
jgi:hypothetical protein